MFNQTITKKDFELVRFPNNGELKIVLTKTPHERVEWKYGDKFANGERLFNASEELVALLQLDLIAKKFGVTLKVKADYLPFKRQDKDKLLGEIKFNDVYKNIFSNLEFTEFAPHDKDEFFPSTCEAYLEKAKECNVIVYPDCGAQYRFHNLITMKNKIIFNKVRNANTGSLEFAETDLTYANGSDVAIFDDIIAKGGTFMYVASKLKEAGAKSVTLIVNHADNNEKGEYIYDEEELKKSGVDKIIILNGDM